MKVSSVTHDVHEAITELKKHPDTPVKARIEGLAVEIRVLPRKTLGDVFREVGRIDDDSAEAMLRAVREAREPGGTRETPAF